MYFKRKAYDELLEWKDKYAGKYAVLLEGARRVGKSTIAEQFAANEYKSYIIIDFSNTSNEILSCFNDINNPDIFFLRLQAVTGTTLYLHESVIIFDEVQLYPKVRQAVKHLVRDGRYHYIETGSLISIKRNVKDIVIPSEEMKIQVYPMDYEEFCNAAGMGYSTVENFSKLGVGAGQQVNRKLMRDFRIYMAVGGMPQAVKAYVNGENFSEIDMIKRQIINLYDEDFRKLDPSGKLSAMYRSVPSQLSRDVRRYRISTATGRKNSSKTDELLFELVDSRTVNICYNSTDPRASLSSTADTDSYKLYISDTGLFVTLMFMDRPSAENELYARLLADKLPANLGYLYENAVAQMIVSSGRALYYHTWEKKESTHYYEIDFLITNGTKVTALEVKSSGTGKHESLSEFRKRYSAVAGSCVILSQKDYEAREEYINVPVYMTPFII